MIEKYTEVVLVVQDDNVFIENASGNEESDISEESKSWGQNLIGLSTEKERGLSGKGGVTKIITRFVLIKSLLERKWRFFLLDY